MVHKRGKGSCGGISQVNIMNAPLVIIVLLNSLEEVGGIILSCYTLGGGGWLVVGHCPIFKVHY